MENPFKVSQSSWLLLQEWEECSKRGFLVCALTTFLSFLYVVASKGEKRLFKFENIWLKEAGFMDRVRLWWASYTFQGSPSFVLAQKLNALKVDLKLWNEQVFENVDSLKKACLEDLCALDRLEEERGLDSEELLRKSMIVSDLENNYSPRN
jgi:hypothetical protein